MTERSALESGRILIAEDNPFVAFELGQYLMDSGCQVVGPAGTVDDALRLAKEEMLDGALLDLNLRDRSALPVARELMARGSRWSSSRATTTTPSRGSWHPCRACASRSWRPSSTG